MTKPRPSAKDRATIDALVQQAMASEKTLGALLLNLFNTFSSDDELMRYVHSMKWRTKHADHLRDKLHRKWHEAHKAGRHFNITKDNLFTKINDIAGFRILHLHTRQFQDLNRCLQRIFSAEEFRVREGPSARTWDDESRDYFSSIGTPFKKSSTLYTSVHYVIAPNSRSPYTCELQVRTLAEELWGEVDHTLNYPHESESVACKEQIKVLARVTSSCSRLVDSIFLSHQDFIDRKLTALRVKIE